MYFGGFLPSKKGERRKRLAEICDIPATIVLYEAPHRLGRSLIDCHEILGDRRAAVARELTKLHEEIVRGTLKELSETYAKATVKGEMVLVIDRPRPETVSYGGPASDLAGRVQELEKDGFDPRSALKKAAKEFGLSKSAAYRIVESEKGNKSK